MNYWLLSLTFIAVNLDFFLSANLTSIFRKRRGAMVGFRTRFD